MKILGFDIKFNKQPAAGIKTDPEQITNKPEIKADFGLNGGWGVGGSGAPIINVIYGGEKNIGELGPALKYTVDHVALGIRAWQMDMENEVAHNIVKQKVRWVIGDGLDLDAEPQIDVLSKYGVKLDPEKFNKEVESLWKVYGSAKVADYANRVNLHKIAKRAMKNAETWGDCLVVLRADKSGNVKVQLIDGQWVQTPVGLSYVGNVNELIDNKIAYDFIWTNGNRVRWGVEIDDNGEHVAYHVRTGVSLEYERIQCRGSRSGSLMAYLVYGSEYRLDNLRGIPSITQNMESAKQLDEYTSAMVSGVVERAKLAMFFTHEKGTIETSPIQDNFLKAHGVDINLPVDADGKNIARDVAVTTNKQVFNLPAGADVKAIQSDQETHYKEFYETRRNAMCATFGMPPEVASMLYGGSYSASRAATNGFQYSLNIDRDEFGDQFYQPIYDLQLDLWVLTGKVTAPGYLNALLTRDEFVLAAYRYANWNGDPVPQIDALKEVQAYREMLGTAFNRVPLTTVEKITRNLANGSFKANLKQAADELQETEKSGIEPLKEFPDPVGGEPTEKKKPTKKTTEAYKPFSLTAKKISNATI